MAGGNVDASQPVDGYCIRCGYALKYLTPTAGVYRCPECGRVFDPADIRSFRSHPHGRFIHWIAMPIGKPTLVVALAAALAVTYVSRWKWGHTGWSVVDCVYYFTPSALRHGTSLVTTADKAYTAAVLLAVGAVAWFLIRGVAGLIARWKMGSSDDELPVHYGRRYALLAIATAITSMGVFFGWPYRLAQQWVARKLKTIGGPVGFFPTPGIAAPTTLTAIQLDQTLRAAVMQLPTIEQRLGGLKVLLEEHPHLALPILNDAVRVESDVSVRATEIQLIGLHRDIQSVEFLRKCMNDPDIAIRIAAMDAMGMVYAPAYPVPLDGGNNWPLGAEVENGSITIALSQFIAAYPSQNFTGNLEIKPVPLPNDIRRVFSDAVINSNTTEEREAAARALLPWPPEKYRLRVAEWGVWLNDGGKLTLVQSVLDEIPPFVHRTGNPVNEFDDRINRILVIDKPILHVTVDQLMLIDVKVLINLGRPWFAYPRPDDFAAQGDSLQRIGTTQPTSPIAGLDPVEASPLSSLHTGYPHLLPEHESVGPINWQFSQVNGITGLGLRWQSVIVSPQKLSWMIPPEVPKDPKFAWWEQLRDVPSAWVSNRGETERFLYYDGPTVAPAPVKLTWTEDRLNWSVPVEAIRFFVDHDRSPRRMPLPQAAILIRRQNGRLSGQVLQIPNDAEVDPTAERSIPADNLNGPEVRDAFHHLLTTAGLTAAEAEGLLRAWEQQFFQTAGRRIITIMKRDTYDTFCPIQIRPTPTELVRVGLVLSEFA